MKRRQKTSSADTPQRTKFSGPIVDSPPQTMGEYLFGIFGNQLWSLFSRCHSANLKKKDFSFEDSPSEEARKAWKETKEAWKGERGQFNHIRILGHLHRLTRSSPLLGQPVIAAEMDFGVAMLRHFPSVFKSMTLQTKEIARQVLEMEYEQTKMFWTVAPYLFKHLKASGMEDKAAILTILKWAGEPALDVKDVSTITTVLSEQRYILCGFSINRGVFFLDAYNSEDLSHKVADRMAEYIAKTVLLPQMKGPTSS